MTKRNPNDLTLRNLRAMKKRLVQLTDRVIRIERGLQDQRAWDRQVAITLNRISGVTSKGHGGRGASRWLGA